MSPGQLGHTGQGGDQIVQRTRDDDAVVDVEEEHEEHGGNAHALRKKYSDYRLESFFTGKSFIRMSYYLKRTGNTVVTYLEHRTELCYEGHAS